MPHQRSRHIIPLIENALKLSPLVGLIGHRQVGKTTLLEKICSKYYVLDQKKERDAAISDPEGYLKSRAGKRVALDECQTVPELFPELKEWVRTHKTPGQFLLSGSIRFTSREAIRESLTGRIVNLELLPLTISELLEKPLSAELPRILRQNGFSASTFRRETSSLSLFHSSAIQYLEAGGLPGICFLRDLRQRAQKIEEQLVTLLDRDLRLIQKVTLSLNELRSISSALAETQGLPLDYTDLKRRTGVSTPTIKKVLACLEAIFILRLIPVEGGSSRGMTIYFEDLAERRHLCSQTPDTESTLTHFYFSQFRAQFQYRPGEPYEIFQYRTRGGALVPLCFRTPQGTLGILPVENPKDVERFSASARSFLGRYSNSKVLYVHLMKEHPKVVNDREAIVPFGCLA